MPLKQEVEGRTLLLEFSKTFKLTLRQIQQAVHRVGLVFTSMPDGQESFFLATMAAVILRTINTRLYHEFINKKSFGIWLWLKEYSPVQRGRSCNRLLKGTCLKPSLILAYREIAGYGDYRLKFHTTAKEI